MILLDITDKDYENINELSQRLTISHQPNLKLSIYKNRGGSCNKCYIWMYADKGICRFEGLFVTDWKYNPIPISPTEIKVGDFDEL